MSFVVDLPPEVETRVRLAAASEGVDVSTFVYETLAPRLRPGLEAMSEEELIAKAREDFPQAFWDRFAALAARSEAGELTSDEWKEYTSCAERTEVQDAERLRYLIEISRRRGCSPVSLIKQLGLRSGMDGWG